MERTDSAFADMPIPPIPEFEKRIPWLNRWDVKPVLGTLVGPFRVLYGIVEVILGLLISPFCCNFSLCSKGISDITRGATAFVSFIPAVSRYLKEQDLKKAWAEHIAEQKPPGSGGESRHTGAGGKSQLEKLPASAGVDAVTPVTDSNIDENFS